MSLSDFLINSDNPLDKVIYLFSSSASMDGSTFFNFPHGLKFSPLLDIEWSYTPDFTLAYGMNQGPPSSSPFYIFDLAITVESDTDNVYINCFGPAPTKTVYYRIFGFQPDDSNEIVAPTASSGDKFVLNSSYNYPKLVIANHFNYLSGVDVNITVPHDLGLIPQAKVWLKGTRTGLISVCGDDFQGLWQIKPTSSTLSFALDAFNNFSAGTVYYRIYSDK